MRPLLWLLVATVASACNITLPFPGGGQGYATVVHNATSVNYVIEVWDEVETRYYETRPGTSIVVDTVGEGNRPAVAITVLDATCSPVKRVQADFSQGGMLTISSDDEIEFAAYLRQSADQRAGATESCEPIAKR